jgi:hypothetical protein
MTISAIRRLSRACRTSAAAIALWASTTAVCSALDPIPSNFAEFNTSVAGYQDYFEGDTLNAGWSVYGNGTWGLSGDGYLLASSGTTDPSKLLYNGPAYNATVQNVLAMVRVTAFGPNGDIGSRAGVTSVSNTTTGHGIDYIYYGNGNGIQKSEFLNDFIAHGPTAVTPDRALNTDYWVRLLHEPNKAAGGDPAFDGANDAFAKIWPADGTTPEPANYQYSWNSNDTRSGLAGLMIGHDNISKMEVGYTLIQAAGLPNISVGTYVPPIPPDPPPATIPSSLGNYGRTVRASSPVAFWRLETNVSPPTDSASAAGFPQFGPQNGIYQNFNPENLGQPGPRPTDLVNGLPLLGFSPNNYAADFQGAASGGNDVALFADDGTLNMAPGGAFTLEAWVKGSPTQETGAPIIAKGDGAIEQFTVDVVGNNYRFYVRDGANPGDARVLQSSVGPNDSWQHVVAVFDAAEGYMRLYVNGVQAPGAIPVPPSTIIDNLHDISVGSRQSGADRYDFNFDGLIDEVAVYKYALPETEIVAHFQAAFVPEPSSFMLVGIGLALCGGVYVRKNRRK